MTSKLNNDVVMEGVKDNSIRKKKKDATFEKEKTME